MSQLGGYMRRLGMWNRLAIVAATLFSLIFPTVNWFQQAEAIGKLQSTGYAACTRNTAYVPIDGKSQFAYCGDLWFKDMSAMRPGWGDWWPEVVMCLVASAIVYLLIWTAVSTIKWIWRGRAVGQS